MPVKPVVPMALRNGPFTVKEATAIGVSRDQLRSARYRRLGSGVYRWVGLSDGPQVMLGAMAKRMPPSAAFSGHTAAWLHGVDAAPCDPIEVTIPCPTCGRRTGALVKRAALEAGEIVVRRGLPTTSALRTVADLGARDPITEGVVVADQFLHARLVTLQELRRHVAGHSNAKGVARLRRVVDLAEPKSESAMETRLRLLLVLAGLPRPEVQVPLRDDDGNWLGRPDLFYRAQGLAIEYDGGNHRDRLVEDNRRQNGLIGAGLRLLRFTAADVYGVPNAVVTQVRHALHSTIASRAASSVWRSRSE